MRKLSRIASVAAVIVSLLAVPAIALAATQYAPGWSNCALGGPSGPYVEFRENKLGDFSDGNDNLYMCRTNNISAFGSIDHTLPGNCNVFPLGSATWDGCIDSVNLTVSSGNLYRLCVYKDISWHGTVLLNVWKTTTGTYAYNLSQFDAASSAKFTHYLNQC